MEGLLRDGGKTAPPGIVVSQCWRWDSNPYGTCVPADFKSQPWAILRYVGLSDCQIPG